ncbi:unnamed protein product [Closterium sp. Naga37s-1]|nr:unnamed protein product [Closterium sp. Naga37s-1]
MASNHGGAALEESVRALDVTDSSDAENSHESSPTPAALFLPHSKHFPLPTHQSVDVVDLLPGPIWHIIFRHLLLPPGSSAHLQKQDDPLKKLSSREAHSSLRDLVNLLTTEASAQLQQRLSLSAFQWEEGSSSSATTRPLSACEQHEENARRFGSSWPLLRCAMASKRLFEHVISFSELEPICLIFNDQEPQWTGMLSWFLRRTGHKSFEDCLIYPGLFKQFGQLQRLKLCRGRWQLGSVDAAWFTALRSLTISHVDCRDWDYNFLSSITPQLHEFFLSSSNRDICSLKLGFAVARVVSVSFEGMLLTVDFSLPPTLKSLSISAEDLELLRIIAPTVETLLVRHGWPMEDVDAEWSRLRSLGIAGPTDDDDDAGDEAASSGYHGGAALQVIAVTFPPPYRRFPPPVSPVRRPISRARRPISPSRGPISPSCRPISPSRILSPFRVASSRLSARPPLASPRGLLSSLRAASSRLSARPPLTSPRGLLSPPRAVSSRLPARPPLASPRGLLSPPLATPRGLLSPLRAASSRLSARPPLASPRGLLSPLRAASSPLPLPSLPPSHAIASPSRRPRFPSHRPRFPLPSPSLPPPIALASPSHRPRFPLPSPSLPPPVALASPSLCPRFPLPSPSLPPPIALASPSRRPCFPLPSPSLPPPIASPLAPSVSVGQQHHQRLLLSPPCLPLPPLPPKPPPTLPLQLLVHLRHLSVWGSSITNASAPLLPFPTPTILFPPPPLPLPLQSLVHLRHLSVWGSSITSASASLLLAFPRLLSANLAWTALSHLPAHPSLTALHLSHCPLLSIGFPLPSSSSSPSASSPSSSHSSSSSSFPLTHLVLSGASIAPPSSLFPPHLLAFLTHLTSTPLLLLSLTPFCYTSPTPFPTRYVSSSPLSLTHLDLSG